MKKIIFYALILANTFFVAACGGGGGSSSSSSSSSAPAPAVSTSTTYTTSSGAGEVISFAIDVAKKTYTYSDTQSSYGFTGNTGTGTLTSQNSDGSWNLSASSDNFIKSAMLLINSSGLLAGQVTINYGGGAGNKTNPVFGVSNPIASLSNLAGTYNYISYACLGKSYGAYGSNCGPAHGTIAIDSSVVDGAITYKQCQNSNLGSDTSCASGNVFTTGKISTTSNPGTYNFLRDSGGGRPSPINGSSGTFIAFTAPNGQKIIITDLSDNFYGYGHLAGSTQSAFSSGSGDGDWYWVENSGLTGTTTVSGLGFIAYPKAMSTVTGTLGINANWPGLINLTRSDGSTGYIIAAGTGLYISHDNTSYGNYEVGLKK